LPAWVFLGIGSAFGLYHLASRWRLFTSSQLLSYDGQLEKVLHGYADTQYIFINAISDACKLYKTVLTTQRHIKLKMFTSGVIDRYLSEKGKSLNEGN
jgi:hypothetical protein